MARLRIDRTRTDTAQEELDADMEGFIEDVMYGKITVDEEGHATVHTEHEDLRKVRFGRRPTGNDRCAMDKCKNTAEQFKFFAWVASATGIAAQRLTRLDEHDWTSVWRVFKLFLAA